MTRAFRNFQMGLLLTMMVPMLAANESSQWRTAFGYLILYVLLIFWRQHQYGMDYLVADQSSERKKWHRKVIHFFGSTLSDERAEIEERADLYILGKVKFFQSLAVYVLLNVILSYILLRKTGGVLPKGFIFIAAMGFPLAFASHIGIFLVSLFVSLLYFLYAVSGLESLHSLWIAAYTFAFFYTLVFYKQVIREGSVDKLAVHPLLTALSFRSAGLFLLLVFTLNLIWPLEKTYSPANEPPKPNPVRDQIVKQAARAADKVLSRKGTGDGGAAQQELTLPQFGTGQSTGGKSTAGTTTKSNGQNLEGIPPGLIDELSHKARLSKAEAEDLLKNSTIDKQELEKIAKGDEVNPQTWKEVESFLRNQKITQQDQEKFRKELEKVQAQPDPMKKEELLRNLEAAKHLKPEDLEKLKKGRLPDERQMQEALGKLAGEKNPFHKQNGGTSRGVAGAPPGHSPQSLQSMEPKTNSTAAKLEPSPEAKVPTPQEKEKKRIEKLEKKILTLADQFEKLLKVVAFFALLAFIYVFFLRTKEKPKSEKAQSTALSEEDNRNLREQLAKLKHQHLPPREEIIQTYQTLLQVFAAVDFAKPDDLPPGIFKENVKRSMPHIGDPMNTVTSCFEDTLYGEKSLPSEALDKFRKSTRSICGYFNL